MPDAPDHPRALSARRAARTLDAAWVLFFALVLALPNVDERLRPDAARGPFVELRRAHAHPRPPRDIRELQAWPRAFEDWFDDRCGLRDRWLAVHGWLAARVLDRSPAADFLLGRDGWIFFASEEARADFRGVLGALGAPGASAHDATRFDRRLVEQWRSLLEARRDALAARGVRYLFVVAPNKETVYRDFYPPEYTRIGPTARERIVPYLAQHSTVDVLDLTDALRAERELAHDDPPLYFPHGTHWMGRGAFVAAREIVARLARVFPGVEPPRFEDGELHDEHEWLDSLGPALYLGALDSPAWMWRPRVPAPIAKRFDRDRLDEGRRGVFEFAGDAGPRPCALILHDSFLPLAEDTLAESFAVVHSLWQHRLECAAIEAWQPDVVIDVCVERKLLHPELFRFDGRLPDPSTRLGHTRERLRFELETAQDLGTRLDGGESRLVAHDESVALELAPRSDRIAWRLPDALAHAAPGAWLEFELECDRPTRVELASACCGRHDELPTELDARPLAPGTSRVVFDLRRSDCAGALVLIVRRTAAPLRVVYAGVRADAP